jgi:hypothetical protein
MGSGLHIKRAIKKYGESNFKKKIIHFCENELEMKRLESKIVDEEFIKRNDTYNIKVGGHGGFRRGVVSIMGKQVTKEEFHKNKLVGVCSGKIAAFKEDGKIIQVDANDIRLATGELIRTFQKNGTVSVINTSTGEKSRVTMKIFHENEKLESVNKNIATLKNKDGKIVKINVNDIRIKNESLSGHTKGKNFKISEYKIYDDIGEERYQIINENFVLFCKKNNLPWGALRKSYRNNGKPIYQNVGSNKERLNKNNLIQFINWFAIKIK